MSDFSEFVANLEKTPDTQGPSMDTMEKDALKEIGDTTDINGEDASWLENLFHRIFASILDTSEQSEGYETEVILPSEVEESAAEGIEAHDIEDAAEEWHVQSGDYSCAVCAQQFIINEFMDLNVTEEELCSVAEEHGWFAPECGTVPADVGNLLELYGIDTYTNYEGSISDIKETLDQGGRVIVGVDAMVLWVDGFGNYPMSGADHAIEVIGIDDSDPLDVKVVINDSGSQEGCGRVISYLEFMEAWTPSGGFMVSAFPMTDERSVKYDL